MSFVIVEGNATADATLREFTNKRTGNVVPISNATIAVNDRRYDPDTEQWEDTGRAFYEVTVTGSEAAHFAATAVKGARLLIAGELYTEEYRDPDGNPRTRRRITARNPRPQHPIRTCPRRRRRRLVTSKRRRAGSLPGKRGRKGPSEYPGRPGSG